MQDSDDPRLGGEQQAELAHAAGSDAGIVPSAPVQGGEPHPLDAQPGDGEIPVVAPPAADAAPGDDPEEQLREERLTSLFESAVYGPGDERIGKVGQVYIDDQTQEPNWVTVKTGLFGTKEYFLPLDEAVLDGRRLIVPYSKELVAGAPGTEIDQNLSPAEEDELYDYYRVPGRMTGAAVDAAMPAAPATVPPAEPAEPIDPRGLGLDGGEPTTGMPVAPGAGAAGASAFVHPAFDDAPTAAFAPPAQHGASSDAAFAAEVRGEHGTGDDRRPGGTPDDAARLDAEADELSWMDAGERELGTPRVHDESRGSVADGEGGAGIREEFARREQEARDLDAAGSGVPAPVDLDAFRRPEGR